MAYSIKYLFKFESAAGTTREIRVLKDGYSGAVIQRPLGRAPMLKKQQNGPVHGTSLEFFAECNVDREFIEFYTSNPKDYRVDLYAGSTLLWQGYITPELYSEPDIAPPYDVQVVATDGVGELKLYDYAAQGTVTLRNLLAGLLTRTGLGTDIYLISSLKPGSAGAGSLLEKTINLDYMAGKTCYDVLTYVLDTLHATITWWKGAWILTRETNVTFTNGKVRYFNTAGNSALLNDSVQVLGKMYTNPAWPVGQLSTVIDPAKNKVVVQAPWHPVTCLQNPDMTSDANWTKSNGATYATDGYQMPQSTPTPGITQTLSVLGLRVPMSLRVRATGLTSLVGINAIAWLGVVLTYTVGNVTYYLYKDDTGAPVWRPEAGGNLDFEKSLVTWNATEIEAKDLTVENIPAFFQGNSFPAGTLAVNIAGSGIKVYSAYLDVTLPKGYADILRLNNGARGEGDTVEIAIGRETTDNAYYAAFLQGLLLDSGSLITSFSDANFTSGMDYLAFIARDYALSVALPRAKVTGTVFLESSVQIPPLVFTKGGLDYWVETWGWNLYEDELEISARTLPSASLTVQSETILESNGSTVSSAGGPGSSGSSMGGGGGTNYWEIDGTLNTLLKPKDAYAYVHSKDGLFFTGATLSGTVVPDLYVDTVNNQRVLRSPLPLITSGDQIVISGTPGGGGGGGGATNLKELEDVYHNASGVRRYSSGNVGNTDLLGYDSTKGWYAVQLGTGLSMTNGVLTATNTSTGTVTQVKVGSTAYNPTDGVVSLPAYPTTLPASDVSAWAKASTKPSYAFSEISGTASASQIPSTVAYQSQPNNFVHSANEWTVVPSGYSGNLWLNYRTVGGANGGLTNYDMGNGANGYASVTASSFIKKGGTSSQFLKADGSVDSNTYLTGNQTITLSGDVTGSGTTAITTTIGAGKVTNAMLAGSIANAKLANSAITINGSSTSLGGSFSTASITAGTAGTSSATSGLSISVPYVTMNKYGIVTAYGTHTHSISKSDLTTSLESSNGYYVKKSGDTMTGDLYIITGDTDKCIQFSYTTSHLAGAAWRIISNGTGTGDTNYLSFQTGGSSSSATTWNNVLRLSMDNRYVGINMDAPAYQLDVNGTARVTSLKIGSATITWNSNGYLHIDKPLVTAGDQIVISGTPGGGGGGGATTLAGLDDVTITSVANGQLLQYDGSKWVNVAASSVGGVTSVAGRTGAITLTTSDITNIETWISGKGYITSYTDTKNTTGADNTTSKIFLVGPTAQTISNGSARTYSNSNCYASGGYLYSGGLQVLTSHQTLYNLVINNSAGTAQITYKPGTSGTYSLTLTNAMVGLSNVENTALSTWAGTTNITTLGTITSGTWSATTIAVNKGDTGLTTWTGAYRLIYSTAATTLTTLAPNSTTTRKFLRQVGANNAATAPAWDTVTKTDVGLSNVENTALSTWAGTSSITTLGTITSGTWNGSAIAWSKLSISAQNLYDTIGSTKYAPYNSAGYLPLTGGKISGSIVFEETAYNSVVPFVRNMVDYSGGWERRLAAMQINGTDIIKIGATGNGTSVTYSYIGVNGYTGENLRFYPDSTLKFGDNTVWHAGNDGAGSGLDADLFDGLESSAFFISNGNRGAIDFSTDYKTGYEYVSGSATNGGTVYAILFTATYGDAGMQVNFGRNTAMSYRNRTSNSQWSSWRTVYDTANANLSTVDWACKSLTANSGMIAGGSTSGVYFGAASGGLGSTYTGGLAYVYGNNPLYFHTNGNNRMIITGGGNVGIGTTSPSQKLSVVGAILSTGDQVVSSDLTLKTNLTPVTYSVADIAKARAVEFDWKDGRGHSMGSIAQDWLGIAPALVHGEEGNMSLAYGQLALVNTILLARQSESHEERIKELEARVAELEMENEQLRMN